MSSKPMLQLADQVLLLAHKGIVLAEQLLVLCIPSHLQHTAPKPMLKILSRYLVGVKSWLSGHKE